MSPRTDRPTATFRPHPRGFGFATLDRDPDQPPADDVFVPPPAARGLLDGDHISFTVTDHGRGPAADDVKLQTRSRRLVSGQVRNGRLTVDPRLGQLTVDLQGRRIEDGQVVVAELDGGAARPVAGPFPAGTPDAAHATVVTRLLPTGPGVLLDAAARRHAGFDHTDDDVLHQWAIDVAAGGRGGTDDLHVSATAADEDRRDRTGVPTVTIDGPTTRDLDDAISASRDGDRIRVAVHIADVAAAVADGSQLDRHARRLATSVYLPGVVAPMFPPELSEDRLSLLPNVERDTLTVSYTVAPDGAVSDVDLAVTRIRSDAQLTYSAVQARLDGSTPKIDGDAGTVWPVVDDAARAARWLGVDRDRRTRFDGLFDEPDWHVSLVDGAPVATPSSSHTDAELLIERLMVAANEAVARWLVDRNVPALFRAHDGVDIADDGLQAAADRLELELPDDAAGIEQVRRQLARDGRDDDLALLDNQLAYALGRAAYTSSPALHVGLDSQPYTHFTSPIRRYVDLTVHRVVRAVLAGQPAPYTSDQLDAVAAWVNLRSGAAARAESAARRELWALLLNRRLDDGDPLIADATVTKLTPAGAKVRLSSHNLTGFVPAGRLIRRTERRSRPSLTLADDRLATRDGSLRTGQDTRVRLADVDDDGSLVFAPYRR